MIFPMRFPTLCKAVAASVIVLSAFVLTAVSVPESTADTSVKAPSTPVQEALQPASSAPSKKKVLTSITKTKRPAAAKQLALVLPPAETTLLPVVKQKDITEHHQKIADRVLRALPSQCRTYLKNFFVKYKDVKQRGLGGKTTIIIDGTPGDEEFAGLLVHECGHVTHANMQGTSSAPESAYSDGLEPFYTNSPVVEFFAISWMTEEIRKAGSTHADFVSGYAESDAFEDFAETFAMYILHRPAMRERAKDNTAIAAKLAWMELYLPVSETAVGTDAYTWNNEVPWDVTKLPMTLAKN